MAKPFDFQWQISVPDCLLQGGRFDRWEEVSYVLGYFCLTRVCVNKYLELVTPTIL